MLRLATTFVIVMLKYQLATNVSPTTALLFLPDDPRYTDTAIHVNFDTIKSITVSSWASTTTSLLTAFLMVLLSYLIAYRIMGNLSFL